MTKTREQNSVNLKQNLWSSCCSIEVTDRHEASRGLFVTAELLVNVCLLSMGHTVISYSEFLIIVQSSHSHVNNGSHGSDVS